MRGAGHPHAPAHRAINNQGDGTLFDRRLFVYDEKTDTFRCPAGQRLVGKQLSRKDWCVMYAAAAQICGACVMKNRCTSTSRRWITRHLREGALQRMNHRATAKLMRLRRCTGERPFAVLKHIAGPGLMTRAITTSSVKGKWGQFIS